MEKPLFYQLKSVKALQTHWEELKTKHLRDLIQDEARNQKMTIELANLMMDYTHESMDVHTLELFRDLAKEAGLFEKVDAMFQGKPINKSEKRAVLHTVLRMSKDKKGPVINGEDTVAEVHKVLDKVFAFASKVREGKVVGFTGKPLINFVVIGIGGSYLSVEFVYEAIRYHEECKKAGKGFTLKFLPNVDPVDFVRVTEDLNPEQTLFIINSKTLTTAETMLNARTCRNWLWERYSTKISNMTEDRKKIVARHMCAVSTNLKETKAFGIEDENVFAFWDWVGGRYSVWSAIGILPLSLCFGPEIAKAFLAGGEHIDEHFRNTKDITKNLPVMLGLIGFYNTHIQKMESRAILPYSQCLHRFVPHIQQVSMESNGKDVSIDGVPLKEPTGPIVFGEPGTNGQHSFYQLIHQGRKIPCEFIAFAQPIAPISVPGEAVANHDELMSNFFAQPDALARGFTLKEVEANPAVKEYERPYKVFEGNRPSLSILFDEITPFSIGQLLAIYEHRVAVEGFLFDINSWDQMGVELGKVLAKDVRELFKGDMKTKDVSKLDMSGLKNATPPMKLLIKKYIQKRQKKA